jgi:hypothetical protein
MGPLANRATVSWLPTSCTVEQALSWIAFAAFAQMQQSARPSAGPARLSVSPSGSGSLGPLGRRVPDLRTTEISKPAKATLPLRVGRGSLIETAQSATKRNRSALGKAVKREAELTHERGDEPTGWWLVGTLSP